MNKSKMQINNDEQYDEFQQAVNDVTLEIEEKEHLLEALLDAIVKYEKGTGFLR